MLRSLWLQWRCGRCGSLLGIDRKRRVLAVFLLAALVCAAAVSLAHAVWSDLVAIAVARNAASDLPQTTGSQNAGEGVDG